MFTLGQTEGERCYSVQVRRIDDVLAELALEQVDVIKMDIEGSEFAALHGAELSLRRHKPALLLELNERALQRCGSNSKAVMDLLDDAGYRGWVMSYDGIKPLRYIAADECSECIFIHQTHSSLIKQLALPPWRT